MKTSSGLLLFFILAVAMVATIQFTGTKAAAQSSYFTSQGCSGCHTAPAVATCNGCHAHGTHSNSQKNNINVTGATDASSYAPGATVTVTISGGYRTGWVRAVLYDQNQVELTRSSGNASDMGYSTTLPTTLSAPAPATPGSYTWKVAWYGNQYDLTEAGSGATFFGTGWTPDPNNPNHGSEIVATNSFTVSASADTVAPTVTAFSLPAAAASLTVPVSSFTATDNAGVTGYLITTSATAPSAGAAGWTPTAPASVVAPAAGYVTFYAWAKDAAGNVSASANASVTITLADTTPPVVTAFTLPASATSLTVPISSFTATDNVGVTGYMITTSATAPSAGTAGWTAAAPASIISPAVGSVTFYAWAKDAAGNISTAKNTSVTITLPDTTPPVVSAFTLPATATSLTVPVSSLTATDNVGVTAYMITTNASAPTASAAGWTATAPASVTAPAAGNVTFYAWAKDAAGNVSASAGASVAISVSGTGGSTGSSGSSSNNNPPATPVGGIGIVLMTTAAIAGYGYWKSKK